MAYRDFTLLPVWMKGCALLQEIYSLSEAFPTVEKYNLTSNMRRCCNSIIHNIAEGYGRFADRDKSRFYKISRGSAYEIISQIHVCRRLSYLSDESSTKLIKGYQNLIDELDKLISYIENRNK